MAFVDISSELFRTYEFPDGATIQIKHPVALHVSASGGHRIWDSFGTSHYIPPKWIHLSWEVAEGEPNFVA